MQATSQSFTTGDCAICLRSDRAVSQAFWILLVTRRGVQKLLFCFALKQNGGWVMTHKKFCWILLFFVANAFAQTKWVGSWASSQQIPEQRNEMAKADLEDMTLRQLIHLSIGGPQLRVKVSNRYGLAPIRFTSVHIAKPVSTTTSAIVPGTDKELTFAGKAEVTVPAGADYVSDAAAYPVAPGSDLSITLHIAKAPERQTSHPGSRATSYFRHGNHVADPQFPANTGTIEHWYFISGVDVATGPEAAAIVALGDSITDGRGSTTNENNRWTDNLARRLQANAATKSVAVLNQGTGGNRVLLDSLGPNAMARFDHDVLAQAGVKWLIVFEGINDIGTFPREYENTPEVHRELVHRVIQAYQQMMARAHASGIKVIGATILAFGGSGYAKGNPAGDADRKAINDWIRSPGNFDAVVDFDKVTRDPAHPEQLLAAFDTGDHLHPSVAGYQAIADSIPLSLFVDAGQPISKVRAQGARKK